MASDVTPAPFNARTMIHEYGGGWYTVDVATGPSISQPVRRTDLRVVAAADRRTPKPLTAAGAVRYGDLEVDRRARPAHLRPRGLTPG